MALPDRNFGGNAHLASWGGTGEEEEGGGEGANILAASLHYKLVMDWSTLTMLLGPGHAFLPLVRPARPS